MWNDLSYIWQTAFREMWRAFCAGSTPIGAALCDADGTIILHDRNRNHEPQTLNKRIAHAEANLLNRLDTSAFDPRTLTLYSTMEPCPMCMGTILMANIKTVCIAAADPYCGMTHLLETDPYYRQKNVRYSFEGGALEAVQLTIQAYAELKYIESGSGTAVFDKFAARCPAATETAQRLYETKWLDQAAETGRDISEVFDRILNEIQGNS